jgi:hypothetical protein
LRPPTACKQTVSGTISLPSPGFFSPFPHGTGSLSVTLEYLALPDGPGKFMQDSSCPALLGCQTGGSDFHVRDYHALWWAFPRPFANLSLPLCLVPRPQSSKPDWFRLVRFRSPLLTESLLFSLPRGTEMVHFPRLALSVLYIQAAVTLAGRVSPFGPLRINARLPAPRSFSQVATSFIASKCLGIHRLPLVA